MNKERTTKVGLPAFAFGGTIPSEKPISNEEMLSSYVRFSGWLRYAQAYEQVKTLQSSRDPFQRLVATATLFSACGALIEDVIATLTSWMCWEAEPDLLIADVLKNTIVVRQDAARFGKDYVDTLIEQSRAGRKVRVDANGFAQTLRMMGAAEGLGRLGIKWKKIPSVKLVRSHYERENWGRLPALFNDLGYRLSDEWAASMGASYNKIKHGPQVVVTDLVEFYKRHGMNEQVAGRMHDSLVNQGLCGETLRVLFDGANTVAPPGAEPATIFLDDQGEAALAIFSHIVHPLAKTTWAIGCWIRKNRFRQEWEQPTDLILESEELIRRFRDKLEGYRIREEILSEHLELSDVHIFRRKPVT